MYGDKEGTLDRFRENYRTRLTDEMRARLVLENDEVRFCLLFAVCCLLFALSDCARARKDADGPL